MGGVTCTAAACIDTADYTYSTSTGGSQFGPHVPYASAPGCGLYNGQPNGTANVDLTGTPLAVVPNAFQAVGFIPYGSASYSDGNQVVNLWGNGWCGAENPVDTPLLPLYPAGGGQTTSFASAPANPTYGQMKVVRPRFDINVCHVVPLLVAIKEFHFVPRPSRGKIRLN